MVARDKEHAAAIAARLERIAVERPEIVTSDEADASRADRGVLGAASRRWLVSVLMVSEGVDIPRLRVGVYATAARTELFFRQVVGRFVRRTPTPRAQMRTCFMPADPRLKALAAQIEEERNHALEEKIGEEDMEQPERSPGEQQFHALSSTAHADEALGVSVRTGDELQLFFDPAPEGAKPKPIVAKAPRRR